MTDSVKQKISYPKEAWRFAKSVVKGHVVTFKNLFRKKSTLQYPEVRWELPEGYRGLPALPIDPKTGADKCIGCGACARACPVQIIEVKAHMGEDKKRVVDEFSLFAGRCIFCGLCAEACPTHALVMSKEYELAEFTREEAAYNRERLNRLGGTIAEQEDSGKEVS